MKKMRLLFILCIVLLFAACVSTTVTKSITETTHPDGSKTVSVTKEISQLIQIPETSAAKEVKKEFE